MATSLSPSQPRLSRTPSATPHFNADSPRKRRKYIPGGSGGGGRWVDASTSNTAPTPNPRPSTASRMRFSRPARTTVRPRREPTTEKPTFDSAADAAAAAVQIDGYKPREERGWEEFHPTLELDFSLTVYSANEVDGVSAEQMTEQEGLGTPVKDEMATTAASPLSVQLATPLKRRPGRPPRRPESMLNGLGSPPAQRIVPLPAQNPRERLTLPKPSYREVQIYDAFEVDKKAQENYVDRTMKRIGYQESEKFDKPKAMIRYDENMLEVEEQGGTQPQSSSDATNNATHLASSVQVEYDMDEQDERWLESYNLYRKEHEQAEAIKPAVFEVTMTLIEKEWHLLEKRIPKPNPKPPQTHRPRSSSSAAVNGEPAGAGEEQDSKCAICDDGDCENTNAIVFCDGCDLAVHQECYGVPFIPEGQWLCRKCQQVGRATPTCIFCPNTEGAFKLTSESRWAHLLCAIWIPEVTLGNQTFMEPIMEVAAVPKQRWKLTCYICNQKMGACIQCGNKNCYQAFHVTCARRAKLFLKMKSTHGGPASLDASVLKAFCDRHVPQEWAHEHDVENATTEAKQYYRYEMKGRKWADSQQSALALVTLQAPPPAEMTMDSIEDDGTVIPKKKRAQLPKNIWRLPSGAPVVPQVVTTVVEEVVARFGVRKRKEFVTEVCKYWTLKREARRGAPLLKRLQLQMETFSTAEIVRRDFSAMGAAGRTRLDKRIAFAEQLEKEMITIQAMCEEVRRREETKLKDVELLKEVIDIIYSPVSALIWPVIEKGQKLALPSSNDKAAELSEGGRKMFSDAFDALQANLESRHYGSVNVFSTDLGHVFQTIPGLPAVQDAMEAITFLSTSSIRDEGLTLEQKEAKRLAKRIAKALHPLLIEAMQKEAELVHGKPFEKELKHLELMWTIGNSDPELPQHALEDTAAGDDEHDGLAHISRPEQTMISPPATITADMVVDNEHGLAETKDGAKVDDMDTSPDTHELNATALDSFSGGINDKTNSTDNAGLDNEHTSDDDFSKMAIANKQAEPLTPPRSEKGLLPSLGEGGIPWYLEGFEPNGITIQDESYDGLKVRREMSEELSDMDEEELQGLGMFTSDDVEAGDTEGGASEASGRAPPSKKRRRWKGFR